MEDLGERRTISIRMGWLWVEGTPMRLPLRALNLRQAPPSLCQPHTFALGFTLSDSQGRSLATFWVIIINKLKLFRNFFYLLDKSAYVNLPFDFALQISQLLREKSINGRSERNSKIILDP